MPNVSRINGLRAVKHITGAPFNGQGTLYAVSSSNGTAIFPGDLVKLAADGNAAGIQFVVPATAGVAGTGAAALGVVLAIIPAKMDPVTGSMTAGAIALDTPQYLPASTAGYVYVADSPDLVFETQATSGASAYSFAVADIGQNCNIYAGAGSTSTGTSAHTADLNDKGTAATLPLKVLGTVQRVDNDPTGNYTKILVTINNHQLKGGTGTVGV